MVAGELPMTLALASMAIVAATWIPAAVQAKPEPTLKDVLIEQWKEIGDKVVKLAEEFPEDKYDYKPSEPVRTFADVLRHVAFWNDYVARTARGEKVDTKPNELSKAEYRTKAQIVAALKHATDAAGAELKNGKEPAGRLIGLWTAFIAHSSEHYGQLVVYYRLNGLVPPESRRQ
jgi:uncharacterized damage-inducible protein DinB